MSKMLTFILFLVSMPLASLAVNAEKPNLTFVSLEIPGYTNANGTGTYWQILDAIYGEQYRLQLKAVTPAEYVRLINNTENSAENIGFLGTQLEQFEHLIYSHSHIDTRYAVHLLHNKDSLTVKELGQLVIAAKADDYLHYVLAEQIQWYAVPSIENIDKLIENSRVDAALTYSYNLHLADPTGDLNEFEILPEQKVRVGFVKGAAGSQLVNEFDATFSQLLGDGTIRASFSTAAEYAHADLNNQQGKRQIQWQIIPKKYDPKTQKNTALTSEVIFSQALESHLNNLDLNIKVSSMRTIKKLLLNTENTCVHNIMKTAERETFAYFSKPSYIFLPPRLVMKKSTVQKYQLDQFSENEQIDLAQLLTQRPELRISVVKDGNTYKLLKSRVPEELMSRLYITENNSLNDTFNLMLSNRVDAVITWPSLIAYMIDDSSTAKGLASYNVSDIESSIIESHIACSKSPLGQQVIEQVNKVLADEHIRDELFEAEYSKMDSSGAKAFKEQIKHYHH